MAAKGWQGDSQLTSLLREENILESRPITPPCRNVVRGPVSNGLIVLSPDTACNVHFNPEVTVAAQTSKRHGSADRIQRNLRSVERSSSAGGRLVDERNHSGVREESKKLEPVQKELKTTQHATKKADMNPEDSPVKLSNGTSEIVDDINRSLDMLHVDQDLPLELKADFLSCVMEKNYEKALRLCEELLLIDPGNETYFEFQNTIKEKLQQEESSEEDSEDDESQTDDPEVDEKDESGDSEETDSDDDDQDDDTDNDSSEDDDEGENSETSSESDIEVPPGPINILMGGLPLRPSSAQPHDKWGNT